MSHWAFPDLPQKSKTLKFIDRTAPRAEHVHYVSEALIVPSEENPPFIQYVFEISFHYTKNKYYVETYKSVAWKGYEKRFEETKGERFASTSGWFDFFDTVGDCLKFVEDTYNVKTEVCQPPPPPPKDWGKVRILKLKTPHDNVSKLYLIWEQAQYIGPYVEAKEDEKGLFPEPPAKHPQWKPSSVAWRIWDELEKTLPSEVPSENEATVAKLLAEAKPWVEKWEKVWVEREKESQMAGEMLARRLLYPLEKETAREAGFEKIEAYEKAREAEERRRNTFFMGFYVGEFDQDMLADEFKRALDEPEIMPKGTPDAIAWALVNYGYSYGPAEKQFDKYHQAFQLVDDPYTGKKFLLYTPTPRRPLWAIKNIPPEERDFPAHNYGIDRRIVESVLTRKGWTFGTKGWQPPPEVK